MPWSGGDVALLGGFARLPVARLGAGTLYYDVAVHTPLRRAGGPNGGHSPARRRCKYSSICLTRAERGTRGANLVTREDFMKSLDCARGSSLSAPPRGTGELHPVDCPLLPASLGTALA